MKKIFKFILLFIFFDTYLLATSSYSCMQNDSIEQFKHDSMFKLEKAFDETDIEIFSKLFQIKEIKEISNNKINKISTCQVIYKIVPMDRSEALGYLYSLGNDYSEFKNILITLSCDNKNKRDALIDKLNKISKVLPKTIYSSSMDGKKVKVKIDKFSIYELLKKELNN